MDLEAIKSFVPGILSLLSLNADKDTLKSTFDGAFEQNKLTDSTKLIPCIDDDSAAKIVAFVPQALDKASSGSLSDLLALPALIK